MSKSLRKFILSCVALCVTLALLVGAVFAWFTTQHATAVNGLDFVADQHDVEIRITIKRDGAIYNGIENKQAGEYGQLNLSDVTIGSVFDFELKYTYLGSAARSISVSSALNGINGGATVALGGSQYNLGSFFRCSLRTGDHTLFTAADISTYGTKSLQGVINNSTSQSFDLAIAQNLVWAASQTNADATVAFQLAFGNWPNVTEDIPSATLSNMSLTLSSIQARCS